MTRTLCQVGYEVSSADPQVFLELRELCLSSELKVDYGTPPQAHLFREPYQGHIIRKDPREYTELEREILRYQDHLKGLLPYSRSLIPSHDPPSLFPLTRGTDVPRHAHKHILTRFVVSLILENELGDSIWVRTRGERLEVPLTLPPGTLLMMTGDCVHWVEKVQGKLTVLAFDFKTPR